MDRLLHVNIYQKITFIFQNIQVLIGLVGIIGNILSFSVFLRKPLRNQSYSFYFRIMSWSDNLVLLHTFRHWARIVLKIDIDSLWSFFCRFNEYQPFLAGSISIWLRIIVLADRCVRIIYPNQFKFIKTRLFQIGVVLFIATYSALLHIKMALNRRLEASPSTILNSTVLVCYIPPNFLSENHIVFLINLLICTTLSSVLTIRLISFIYSSRRRLRNKLYKPHSSVNKDRKFAISSIGVNIMSLIGQIVFVIFTLVAISFQFNSTQIEMIITLAITISSCYYASVFFVSLCMNSIFYNEFLRFLKAS